MTTAVCLSPSLSASYLACSAASMIRLPLSLSFCLPLPLSLLAVGLCCCASLKRGNALRPSELYHTLSGILARYLISQISVWAFHLIHNSPAGESAKNSQLLCAYGRMSERRGETARREVTWRGCETGAAEYFGALWSPAYPIIPIHHTKGSQQVMFPLLNRRVCSKLNPSPPSFLSHCVISWLRRTGSKQLDRYRWVKFVFSARDIVLSFPSRGAVAQNSYLVHTLLCRMWLFFFLRSIHRHCLCT